MQNSWLRLDIDVGAEEGQYDSYER